MSGVGEKASGTSKTPAHFFKSIRGKPVVVKLNSGVDHRAFSSWYIFRSCCCCNPDCKETRKCWETHSCCIPELRGMLPLDPAFSVDLRRVRANAA